MIINLNSLSRNFLIFLIIIYFSQGFLYPIGALVSKIVLFSILSISFVYLIKSLLYNSEKYIFYYIWLALLVLNCIGYIFGGNYGDAYFSQFKNILLAMLPFFPFYYFANKGDLSEKNLLFLFLTLLPVFIFNFIFNNNSLIEARNDFSENTVNNIAYFFVSLIPYVFLWKNKKIFSIFSMMILFYFIIQGSKRGALIAGLLSLIVYIYYQLSIIDPKRRVQGLIVSIVGISLFSVFIYNSYINNEFLIARLDNLDQGGSGRDVIYSNLWENWSESNSILNYLFGFGFVSTILYSGTGNFAHNDWLEILTNFGFLGFSIYLSLFLSIIYYLLFVKSDRFSKIILSSILLIWLFKSLFSMFYTAGSTVVLVVLIAYVFGIYKKDKLI